MNARQYVIQLICLVGVGKTTHATHHTKDVVVGGIHANLGSVGTGNGSAGKNKLKSSVVNAGEVAASRWLVFLRAKSKGIHVDTAVRAARVVLEWLHNIEV